MKETIRIRLFAGAREKAGIDVVHVPIDPGARVRDLAAALEYGYPGVSCDVGRWAVNLAFVDLDAPVHPADEIAFIPPVSGG